MANNTETNAEITFRPSEGESINEYLECLSQAIRDLVNDEDLRNVVASGNPVTIRIEGMPEPISEVGEESGDETFDINAFLKERVREFADSHEALMQELGSRTLEDTIFKFFEDLTGTTLRDDKEVGDDLCENPAVHEHAVPDCAFRMRPATFKPLHSKHDHLSDLAKRMLRSVGL